MNGPVESPAGPARPGRIARLLIVALAVATLLSAAAAGLVAWRDRQVVARYGTPAAQLALLLNCRSPPWEEWDRIAAASALVHAADNGEWSARRHAVRIYRHRYLRYYVQVSLGVLPYTRRLCEAD